jgi:DNA-binding MarR family transcriptional regulator
MSHSRYALLVHLRDEEPTTTRDLAKAVGFTAATISRMLEPLVADGLVEREPSGSDRRVVNLRLTDRGRRAVKARDAFWLKRWEKAFEGVDPDVIATATEVLGRITVIYEDPEKPL